MPNCGGTDFRIQGKVLPGVQPSRHRVCTFPSRRNVRRQRSQYGFAASAVPGRDAGRARWALAGERLFELPDHGPARFELCRGPLRAKARQERGERHVNIALGQSALLLGLLGAVAGAVTLARRVGHAGGRLCCGPGRRLHMARRGRRRHGHGGDAESVDNARLHPRLRRQQRQHLHAAHIPHHGHVVGPGRVDPAVGAGPLGLPGRDVDPFPPAARRARWCCGQKSSAT